MEVKGGDGSEDEKEEEGEEEERWRCERGGAGHFARSVVAAAESGRNKWTVFVGVGEKPEGLLGPTDPIALWAI